MRTVVLFTRDLRVHDNPALSEAVARGGDVVPLFVLDRELIRRIGSPNRTAFLLDALHDLRASLGGALVVRERRPPDFVRNDGHGVVAPGELAPAGRDHYAIFTPYWRRWREQPRREVLPAVTSVSHEVEPGPIPELAELVDGEPSPRLPRGGETAGRARLEQWLADGAERYDDELHGSSRLSPHVKFGCLSAVELAARAPSERFLRQLAWRDFFRQLPLAPRRERRWRTDAEAFARWCAGETGVPLVDAGMRQLQEEGWLPNRARLVAASYLTKTLGLDWRLGARHFARLLVDGDTAQNVGNWQWVAGVGANPRPNTVLNPELQRRRHDPDGAYVRAHP